MIQLQVNALYLAIAHCIFYARALLFAVHQINNNNIIEAIKSSASVQVDSLAVSCVLIMEALEWTDKGL